MSAPVDTQQPVAVLQDWKERIAQAHDASLDDDGRGCRAILMTLLADMTAAPAPALVPLTDAQWLKLWTGATGQRLKPGIRRDTLLQTLRFAERAYGIGGKA